MQNRSIDKKKLWKYVNLKLNRSIHHLHVFAVIDILFEEIQNDLKNEKEIIIDNFGILFLKKLKPRRFFDITKRMVVDSPNSYNIIRFNLLNSFKKRITKLLDIEKSKE